MSIQLAPRREQSDALLPWEGHYPLKPWDYRVCAAIPVMDSWEEVGLIIELLRLQTIHPYIVLIDTGSEPQNYLKMEEYRAPDVEVHRIAVNGALHPCDYPAWAMDLAMSLCRSDYLFSTHQDLFLRCRDVIEEMLPLCEKYKAVGYAISKKRYQQDCEGMIGHQCSMFHVRTMDLNYAHWNQRKMCRLFGLPDQRPDARRQWWPDTELPINYMLREAEIAPYRIGQETFGERQVDRRVDHCRAVNTYRLYHPEYLERALSWIREAREDARERIEQWRAEPPPKPKLSVITACSRPQNLPVIEASMARLREYVDLEWIVVADTSRISVDQINVDCVKLGGHHEQSIAGAYQKQLGMERATGEWLYFLDDDTVMHKDFSEVLCHQLRQWPQGELFVFDQVNANDGTLRCVASEECFGRNGIDQGQIVVRRDRIGNARFPLGEYAHDWDFVQQLLPINKVFCRNRISTYNALR